MDMKEIEEREVGREEGRAIKSQKYNTAYATDLSFCCDYVSCHVTHETFDNKKNHDKERTRSGLDPIVLTTF